MVAYDESVIMEFAARLYRRAQFVVVLYALLGGIFGAAVGLLGGGWYAARAGYPSNVIETALLVGAVCFALGFYFGTESAFALRLQAQTALCQAQIERNTRSSAFAGMATLRKAAPPVPADRQ